MKYLENYIILLLFIQCFLFFILKYILIMLLQLPIFFSLLTPQTSTPHLPAFPSLRSCQWVIHISSLASTFPILFLTSPCLFCIDHLCFLFPEHFPPFSSLLLPTDNPPCNLHFCDSVLFLAVCLVCFGFCFLGSVDSCEFVAILLLIVFIFFFFLDKSL
ncbi:hypothetical protein HJG60_010258 [Phyllostomus discolor]|uniref:Uncharacterized protein n=1 Tax=Phyllostomus discolor TaxID=89673 RepID=A0A834EGC8_9CHIR|nr:hypothetical protein HJG60_010258 [Phyllostomus discolor]